MKFGENQKVLLGLFYLRLDWQTCIIYIKRDSNGEGLETRESILCDLYFFSHNGLNTNDGTSIMAMFLFCLLFLFSCFLKLREPVKRLMIVNPLPVPAPLQLITQHFE